ncbi:MAG: alanine racemase [Deltaproteobacteria bacterium]|nr:alanine racemase [Myxococcales bacterium]MDP3218369.1 alanine racemase [Deltaproteobacteria bacterium]
MSDAGATLRVVVSSRADAGVALRPTRAEIDLEALAHNLGVVRALVAEDRSAPPRVYAVVKADAYGHGVIPVARALESAGVDGLCVALVEEGIELRAAGVSLPILVMSGLYGDGLGAALDAKLTPVIHEASQLQALRAARSYLPVRVHLKVDTGMGRLGVTPAALPPFLDAIASMGHVVVEGLMTHFANADCDDPSFTATQLARFEAARALCAQHGIHPEVCHAAASAAAFRMPEARLDLVRVGVALYGVTPFLHDAPGLLPVMRLRTEVIALRELSPGSPVGYGGAWRSGRPSVIATLPVGYADGFFRRLSSDAEVLIQGQRCRVVGNVSMDMTTVDVTDLARLSGVAVGDEAVLLGSQRGAGGFDVIRAEEIARRVGTIPYEVLTAVSRRVPRSYRERSAGR